MRLIVLWDIDHTLIDNAGVSKEIYAAAFTALAGQAPTRPARTEGRTDRLIISDMFRDHGLEPPAWEDALPALEAAGAGRESDLIRRGRVLPGVRQALKAVAEEEGMISSVLTGNIAVNARVKLGAFGLDALLDLSVGAYGADSADRAALVDVARTRIRAVYDLEGNTPVVLIGDTPRDVHAAITTGAHIVALASGVHGEDELRQAGADIVLPDLSDLDALMVHLRQLARR
ncbi:haloacid dehalogenase-like hydrolase [Streptomyces sp. BK205]|uniref:HAD family hydrolase n=1 Tax=Streptomyces sp. BK205 TaxID=2512164 RepID=UPI0010440A24|nr:haloacid dehalogenase-like hydrolase [Streptomyces sp. BK205]TCR22911.1 phosphoglycolate phosphatase-like HAD superfamily hydrolase [Streptomyces sp. BK205]